MRGARRYLGFIATLALVSGGLILIGIGPSRRLGGEEAVHALLAGCGLSVFASVVGSLPVWMAGADRGGRVVPLLASLGLRFLTALGGAALVVAQRLFEPRPFLLWLGICYLAHLAIDVRFSLTAPQRD